MVFDPTEVSRPTALQNALEALDSADSKIVAGNTSMYYLAKKGKLDSVTRLVDISKLGLSYVRAEELEDNKDASVSTKVRKILIGAGTTFSELAASSAIDSNVEYA